MYLEIRVILGTKFQQMKLDFVLIFGIESVILLKSFCVLSRIGSVFC